MTQLGGHRAILAVFDPQGVPIIGVQSGFASMPYVNPALDALRSAIVQGIASEAQLEPTLVNLRRVFSSLCPPKPRAEEPWKFWPRTLSGWSAWSTPPSQFSHADFGEFFVWLKAAKETDFNRLMGHHPVIARHVVKLMEKRVEVPAMGTRFLFQGCPEKYHEVMRQIQARLGKTLRARAHARFVVSAFTSCAPSFSRRQRRRRRRRRRRR
jgi:hypothetical protein